MQNESTHRWNDSTLRLLQAGGIIALAILLVIIVSLLYSPLV